MPPKQRYTRERILDQSYALFLEGGMQAINARSVSKALNCSTQPIFSYFPDMQGLREAIRARAMDQLSASLAAAPSVLARHVAYVRFASRFPCVFLELSKPAEGSESAACLLLRTPEELLCAEEAQIALPREELLHALRMLCVTAHGLAFLLASGILAFDEDHLAAELHTAYARLARAN